MIRINLLPVKTSKRQEAVRTELILAGLGAALLCAFLAMLQVTLVARVNNARGDNNQLQQEIDRKKEIVAEVDEAERLKEDLEKKLAVIQKLKANKAGPVHLLDQLSQATPEKLQLTSLTETNNKIVFQGVAVSNEVISQFLSNLEQSEYFQDVYLNAIDQVEKDGVTLKSFSVNARLVIPGTGAAASAGDDG